MNNGQPRPHSIIDQKISGRIQFDTSNKKNSFPALNVSNNFATLDYDAHINTKSDFTVNHVIKSMTVQELNTLHTVWLYDCPHFMSRLYRADKCFERTPIHYGETIMYVDPKTRQTFNYATPIKCRNNPQNIIELDPDADDGDFYVLTPDPLKREAPQMFKPTQIKTTITPNTFTAQDAGI